MCFDGPGDLKTPDGGLADKITFENPFDPNSKPINLKFNAERPYFNLPQVCLEMWCSMHLLKCSPGSEGRATPLLLQKFID